MIAGRFADDDALFFEIELIAANGLELPVDALFDTGSSGWLAINVQDVEELGWIYVAPQTMRTAQGNVDFDIYLGRVRIDGQDFDIPVNVGAGIPEILIGRRWLKTRRLVADMPAGVLTLETVNI